MPALNKQNTTACIQPRFNIEFIDNYLTKTNAGTSEESNNHFTFQGIKLVVIIHIQHCDQ